MKVVQVIHGYPMRYNAGSEVYTQSLSQGLADSNEVHVFTREEDPFALDFAMRREADADDARVQLHIVNHPRGRHRYRYPEIDRRFAELLDNVKPDVVHFGHLNHLSTSLVSEAASRRIPVVYTLHDYWVMCPRGQFMQTHPADPSDLWAACDGQDHRKCAERCYTSMASGSLAEWKEDVDHWTHWVERRMAHIQEMSDLVDIFIAPSRYLLERYRDGFGLSESKLVYLDYGFDQANLAGRKRNQGEPFTFGYIGTHIAAKGVDHLIQAFGNVKGNAQLRVWGRPRGQETESLRVMAAQLPGDAPSRIEWRSEYKNRHIVEDVFNNVDAIVVPSVWVENSPLVIHEAQQAGVPVITADVGGMAEYVHHEVNGLLFEHRKIKSLAEQMQRAVDDPEMMHRLGQRGYLQSASGEVPGIREHVRAVEELYRQVIS